VADSPGRVLVSAFAPFGGRPVNSSGAALEELVARRPAGLDVVPVVLPVVYGEATRALAKAIAAVRPAAVLALGQADGRDRVTAERVALNLVTATDADESGRALPEEPVLAGGRAAYWSTLPVTRIVSALVDAGVPAAASPDAGGFVCNHLFYGLMHLIATERPQMRGGFVHLPCLPEQVAGSGGPSMGLDTLARAVEIAARTAAE
jgi:pyroglutamyl-peptidase